MTIQNIASFEAETAQTSATSKLVKAWEAKNAKRAVKASGATLMALSLSACGGSDDVAAPTTPVAPVVTPVSLALTAETNILTSADFTTGADTITATQATYGDADVIVEGTDGDGDTLTITTNADITATPTVVGVENINVVGTMIEGAGNGLDFAADGITGATITVSHSSVGSDTATVTAAANVTVVAGGNVDDLSVTQAEDATATVDAGEATVVAITSIDGEDQVATFVANGDVALTLADTAGTMTDLNVTASEASVVTLTDNTAGLDTITGDANTTIDVADISALDGFTITGVAGVVGAAGAITEDFTGIAATITFDNTSSATVADGANLVIDGTAGTVLTLDTDDGNDDVDSEATVNVTVNEVATTANEIVLDNNGFGADLISTLNVEFSIAQTANAFVIDSDGEEITTNLSGDVAVTLTAADLDGELNASGLAGALTVSAHADLLTITGGSGNDVITNVTAEDTVLDGGAGSNTLVTAADNTTATFTNFQLLNVTDGDNFVASQLNGYTAGVVLAGGDVLDLSTGGAGADSIDSATLDISGLTFSNAAGIVEVDLGNIDATVLLAGQEITYTGSNAIDFVSAGANGDTISTGGGADRVEGGAGADTITLGEGIDGVVAQGGDTVDLNETTSAADFVVFQSATSGSAVGVAAGTFTGFNVITGFESGSDTLVFDSTAVAATIANIDAAADVAVADSEDVYTSTQATGTANDLSEGDVADVDAIAAYLNAAGVAHVGAVNLDVDVVAITFADTGNSYVYTVTDADITDGDILAAEITFVASVDDILVAGDITI